MRLLRLRADAFGTLRGEFEFDPDRLTLLVDQNERGKTTLLAAIVAGLYGLEKDQRSHKVLTPLERWRPWEGGGYRVELELECGGERLVITRDFERHTVAVWDSRGRERTDAFREGRDQFPVGKLLLGLDAAEFEKCAFLRQGELGEVVPDDERDRRDSSLRARLENAADTRTADTNATEALKILERAASRYECPAASSNPMKVESAIQRLEARRLRIETDLKALESDLEALAGPLEELATLAGVETGTRERLRRLEVERRATRAQELSLQLRRDDERRAELQALRDEKALHARAPRMTETDEAELRALCVERELAAVRRAELLHRRHEVLEEHRALEARSAELEDFGPYSEADAEGLVIRAGELRRLDRELDSTRLDLESSRAELTSRGFDDSQATELADRFGALSEEQRAMLLRHPNRIVAMQAAAAEAEARRQAGEAVLRAIDGQRRRRSIPGWIVVVLGLAGAGAGGAGVLLEPLWQWFVAVGAGAALVALGAILLVLARGVRRRERDEVRRRVSHAEAELARLRTEQIDDREDLDSLARALHQANADHLLEQWTDYRRLIEERRPIESFEVRLAPLERRRAELLAETGAILARGGRSAADPEALEEVAAGIRRLEALRRERAGSSEEHERLEEALRTIDELAARTRERAEDLFAAAGLPFDPEVSLERQMAAAAAAAAHATRFALLERELVPSAASRLLDPGTRADLEAEIEALAGSGGRDPEPGGAPDGARVSTPERGLAEVDAEIADERLALERLARRRAELATRFEENERRFREEHADKLVERELVERALARAVRFKSAIDLARTTIEDVAWSTHRRWAGFLNQRVGEILARFGTEIGEVRFGDDLDFSLKMPVGSPAPRGRALLQLSSGARDQLHLAVRMAISEFLSPHGVPLPLLLDDCFVTSDDARTRAGMKLLLERVSPERQVILVTCHRARHEALAAMDPELWEQRARWIELRSTAVV